MESTHQNENNVFIRRKIISWVIFIILFILLLIAVVYYFLVYRHYQTTDNAYVKADITWILPRISGEVVTLDVKDYQVVKKGQELLSLDNQDYQARYDQANAALDFKQANFSIQNENEKVAIANIGEAKSSLKVAQADLERITADYRRYQDLLADGVITRQYFDNIHAQYLSSKAKVNNTYSAIDAARAKLASIRASRPQLKADLESAKATRQLYDIDRISSKIIAPVDGQVGSLSVRIGSRVSPQTRLLAIIPDGSIYVEANFKETQIEKMQIGQMVALKFDAYPKLKFQGKIRSFSPASGAVFTMMPPDNATGNFNKVVQRIPVRIQIESSPNIHLVKPGLSVVATVDLRS